MTQTAGQSSIQDLLPATVFARLEGHKTVLKDMLMKQDSVITQFRDVLNRNPYTRAPDNFEQIVDDAALAALSVFARDVSTDADVQQILKSTIGMPGTDHAGNLDFVHLTEDRGAGFGQPVGTGPVADPYGLQVTGQGMGIRTVNHDYRTPGHNSDRPVTGVDPLLWFLELDEGNPIALNPMTAANGGFTSGLSYKVFFPDSDRSGPAWNSAAGQSAQSGIFVNARTIQQGGEFKFASYIAIQYIVQKTMESISARWNGDPSNDPRLQATDGNEKYVAAWNAVDTFGSESQKGGFGGATSASQLQQIQDTGNFTSLTGQYLMSQYMPAIDNLSAAYRLFVSYSPGDSHYYRSGARNAAGKGGVPLSGEYDKSVAYKLSASAQKLSDEIVNYTKVNQSDLQSFKPQKIGPEADGLPGATNVPEGDVQPEVLKAVETLRINTQCLLLQQGDIVKHRFNKSYPVRLASDEWRALKSVEAAGHSPRIRGVDLTGGGSLDRFLDDPVNAILGKEVEYDVQSDGELVEKAVGADNSFYTSIDVNEPGDGAVFLSSLTAKRGSFILNMIPKNLMSKARPYIKFWKVYQQKEGGSKVLIPFSTKPFRDADTKEIVSKAPLLKKVDITMLGTNPAEAESYLKVDVTFNLHSFSAMFNKQAYDSSAIRVLTGNADDASGDFDEGVFDISFIDLITRRKKYVTQDEMESDNTLFGMSTEAGPMIGASAQTAEVLKNQSFSGEDSKEYWNPAHFQIELEYGLRMPSKKNIKQIARSLGPKFSTRDVIDAFEQQKTRAHLTLMNHNIDFKETHNLDIKIEYIGYIEAVMRSKEADILWKSPESEEVIQHKEALHALRAKKDELAQLGPGKSRNELSLDITRKRNQVRKKTNALRKLRYSSILESIKTSGNLYSAHINSTSAGLSVDLTKSGERVILVRGANTLENEDTQMNVKRADPNDFKLFNEHVDDPAALDDSEMEKLKLSGGTAQMQNTSGKNFKFLFMYLGDLVDSVCDLLKNRIDMGTSNTRDLRILLGPFEYYDPTTLQPTVINMADIPIALDYFYAWFVDRVIKPGRDSYTLGQFVRDLVHDLSTNILGSKCSVFASNIIEHLAPGYTKPRFSIALLDPGDQKVPNGNRMKMPPSGFNYRPGLKTQTSYYVMHTTVLPMGKLQGNVEEDLRFGVPHLSLGLARRGLVHRANFKKTDIPYLGEARTQQDAVSLSQFREKYDADVELQGNLLFKPGQYVYLETANISGVGRASMEKSYARTFGFGGYYLVNSVRLVYDFSSPSKASFNTTLECVWQSAGKFRRVD